MPQRERWRQGRKAYTQQSNNSKVCPPSELPDVPRPQQQQHRDENRRGEGQPQGRECRWWYLLGSNAKACDGYACKQARKEYQASLLHSRVFNPTACPSRTLQKPLVDISRLKLLADGGRI